MAQSAKHLPSAQVMISGSWELVPASGSLLGRESASPFPPACALCVSQINKFFKNKKKKSRLTGSWGGGLRLGLPLALSKILTWRQLIPRGMSLCLFQGLVKGL